MSTNADTAVHIPHLHFWQDAVRAMMRNSIALLRLAGEPVNDENLIKLVTSLPRSSARVVEDSWKRGYCYETFLKADRAAGRTEAYREVSDYFLVYFIERHFVAQEVLIDSIRVVLHERTR